jgi:hypothetical protein
MKTEFTAVLIGRCTLRVLGILTDRMVTVTAVSSCGHLQRSGRGRLTILSAESEENSEVLDKVLCYSSFAVEVCRQV